MEAERPSAMESVDTAKSAEETQAKDASSPDARPDYEVAERIAAYQQAAAEEERRRQEEADAAESDRQASAAKEAKVATRAYTVEPGDSLGAIALSLYGDAGRWPEIFEANKDQLSNPNLIYPGQTLRIP
jgi:nucleoid-associated protein YgaU